MSGVAAHTVQLALVDDLPGIVACDECAPSDPSRFRLLEGWVKRGECFVARRAGSLEGFVVLEHGFFGQGFIPLVCVKRSRRRQGLGLRLLAAAERECHTAKLFTSTNASNVAARSLFERAGFVPSGTIENLDTDDPELLYFKRRAVG
jgi:ribosomal protein S18 acetylase RimI-like enzyme